MWPPMEIQIVFQKLKFALIFKCSQSLAFKKNCVISAHFRCMCGDRQKCEGTTEVIYSSWGLIFYIELIRVGLPNS